MSDAKASTLQGNIRQIVEAGASIYTDTHKGYIGLGNDFVHEFIDHTIEYAREAVHTNGMENFWSLLKRGLKGTYVSVMPFHLERYVDEQAFRFNARDLNDAGQFLLVASQVLGRRLTWKKLTDSADEFFSWAFEYC